MPRKANIIRRKPRLPAPAYVPPGGLDKAKLQSKAEKVRKKLGLSDLQARTIANTAFSIYHCVASDLPAENSRGTVSRDVIIEVCLDASRLTDALSGSMGMRTQFPDKDQMIKAVKACNYQELIDLVGPAFQYDEYEAGPAR